MTTTKTIGTVKRKTIRTPHGASTDYWSIDAAPHVLIRVKRVFGKVKTMAGAVLVSDTPEVCVDLRWILQRWPLELSDEDRQYLDGTATAEVERMASFGDVLDGTIPARHLSTALPLRTYQSAAVELVLRSRGLLVGDEMGVGKTAIGIGLVSLPEARPAVVVTVTYLPSQWAAEIQRFLPTANVHIVRKGKPYDLLGKARGQLSRPFRLPKTDGEKALWPDVIILSYSKLAGWADWLSKVAKTVVFDEVHELRTGPGKSNNPIAKYRSARVLADACDLRLGLTGTPVYNYGDEMHNLLNVLRPGVLGTREEFLREWCKDDRIVTKPDAFGTYLRASGLYIRRTRTDVGRELPALTVVPVQLDVGDDPLKGQGGVAAELARRILSRETERGERWRASGELDWRLRQATGIAKAPAVLSFVELLVEQEGPVLLAGWHKAVYELWKAGLDRAKIPWSMFTGDESAVAKMASAKTFIEGGSKVLMMSLRSGAGLDGLQFSGCRNVVIGELDWSPQVHRQLIARLHRDGQTKPISAYYLMSDSGSDPVIVDVLGLKRAQAAGIEDPLNTDIAPIADHKRARALALAYLAAIGEKPPEEQDESDEGWGELGVQPPSDPIETVRKPSLVLTP